MNALTILSLVSSFIGVIVSCTVLITFFRTIKKDIKAETKEITTYNVNQQYMLNDLKEIKAQLQVISQKNETNFQMVVRQEERQNQAEKRLDNLEGKIEQIIILINKRGGAKTNGSK